MAVFVMDVHGMAVFVMDVHGMAVLEWMFMEWLF